MATTALSTGIPGEPVELSLVQTCSYRAKKCNVCDKAKSNPVHKKDGGDHKFQSSLGCAICGRYKKDRVHFGAPPSLNIFGSGNMGAFIGLKAQWEELLTDLLEESGLPKGLTSVVVEAQITFPDDHKGRDEGNIRFLVEKSLGDALVAGGWLTDDTFYPVRRYTFGGLDGHYERGVSALRLMIFPDLSGDELVRLGDAGEVGGGGLVVDVDVARGDAEHDGVDRVAGPQKLTQLG